VTGTLEPADGLPPLRASNADREQVAALLQTAMSEGRITIAELETRLDSVYGATTVAELEPVVRDLPAHTLSLSKQMPERKTVEVPGMRSVSMAGSGVSKGNLIALMSGVERRGIWTAPAQLNAVAIMGGVDLDFSGAQLSAMETVVTVVAIMGGVNMIVPEGLTVVMEGVGIMGGFDDKARQNYGPGSPVLRVRGVAIMGGVEVRRAGKPLSA